MDRIQKIETNLLCKQKFSLLYGNVKISPLGPYKYDVKWY